MNNGCPDLRVVHLSVYNGDLFGLSYDDGGFFRYDGGTVMRREFNQACSK